MRFFLLFYLFPFSSQKQRRKFTRCRLNVWQRVRDWALSLIHTKTSFIRVLSHFNKYICKLKKIRNCELLNGWATQHENQSRRNEGKKRRLIAFAKECCGAQTHNLNCEYLKWEIYHARERPANECDPSRRQRKREESQRRMMMARKKKKRSAECGSLTKK